MACAETFLFLVVRKLSASCQLFDKLGLGKISTISMMNIANSVPIIIQLEETLVGTVAPRLRMYRSRPNKLVIMSRPNADPR